MTDQTLVEFTADAFQKRATATAQHLRDVADRIDREVTQIRPGGVVLPDSPYTQAAQRIAHEFLWGMANANLDGVITAAGEADDAVRRSR